MKCVEGVLLLVTPGSVWSLQQCKVFNISGGERRRVLEEGEGLMLFNGSEVKWEE